MKYNTEYTIAFLYISTMFLVILCIRVDWGML